MLKVPARSVECFYEQTVEEDAEIDVGVQVVRGGDFDVRLVIYNSANEEIVSKLVRSGGDSCTVTLSLPGNARIYKICLDNSFSLWAAKMVHFVLLVHERQDDVESTKFVHDIDSGLDWSNEHSVVMKDVQHRLASVARQLSNVTSTQTCLRVQEAKQRMVAVYHSRRVLMWSVLEMVVIVFAALIQVIAIRSTLRMGRYATQRT